LKLITNNIIHYKNSLQKLRNDPPLRILIRRNPPQTLAPERRMEDNDSLDE